MRKHLFIMDPIADLNLELDSSIRLAYELVALGEAVYAAEPRHLSWQHPDSTALVSCQQIAYEIGIKSISLHQPTTLALHEFAGIHMRKDPPYDLDYISTTWLLDTAASRAKIYNSPQGLRSINEKLAILNFPQFISPTLVSSEPEQLLHFIEKVCAFDAVLKPLTLYGGKGIARLQLKDVAKQEALALLNKLTDQGRGFRLCQPFNPKVFDGEVRVFTVGGKPLSWCLKKPQEGDFMANSNFGSTRHRYQPTPAEVLAVTQVAEQLYQHHGISIIGFDLIGGQISEINVTSPRLLQAPDDPTNYYQEFANWIYQDVRK